MADVVKMVTEVIGLEKRIEKLAASIIKEIKKETNAKKRRKMSKAYKKRDSAALRALWFK